MPELPRITPSSGGPPPGVYSNDVNISHTPWDFVLTFRQLVAMAPDAGSGGGPSTEVARHTIARVLMSPQHTKALCRVLTENVAKYEEVYGEIADVAKAAERRAEQLVREGVIPADVLDPARAAEGAASAQTGSAGDEPEQEDEASGR